MAVVRGLNMETLSHTGGRRRFLTGKAPTGTLARGSNAPLGSLVTSVRMTIPNLSLRVENYNRDSELCIALRVSAVPDLLRAPSLRASLEPLLARQVDEALSNVRMP